MNFVFMIGKVISKPYILSANNIQKATSYFSIEVEMNELKNSYRIDKFSIVVHGALAIYIKENLVIGDTLILQGYIKNRELKNTIDEKDDREKELILELDDSKKEIRKLEEQIYDAQKRVIDLNRELESLTDHEE